MRKKIGIAASALLVLAAVIVWSAFLDRGRGDDTAGLSPTADKYNAPNTITLNGKTYEQNQDLTTVLFIGVDNYGPVEESEVFYNEGQADFLMLAVFDEKKEAIQLLHINRDTMTPVRMLGLGGRSAGTAQMQIALSHCYGKGLQDSCINTRLAVSDLLLGTDIDYYLAMNMDGVALLNDEVGGVTVTIEDEFRDNTEFVQGETVTLHGNQALAYVRGRSEVADGTNINRMKRQRDYIQKFALAFESASQDVGFIEAMLKLISAYTVTDMPLEKMSEIAGRFSDYQVEHIYSLEGNLSYANEFVEFYPDSQSLTRQLAELLYTMKK